MSRLPIEYLLEQTKQFITDFYCGKARRVYSPLHPDILWIGAADNQYIKGYGPVRDYLEHLLKQLPVCAVKNPHFDTVYYAPTLAIITGYYTGYTLPETKEILAALQRLTFIWKRASTSAPWKIIHVHISNPIEFQKEAELFPHAAGKLTYRYMEFLMQKQSSQTDALKFRGTGSETHFLIPDDIYYAEAANIHSILHTAKGPVTINHSLTSLSTTLPPEFIRIHRSYLVNKHHVEEFQRYTVRIKNGILLPIPEKRYRSVSAMLLE